MTKGEGQRIRILYVLKMLWEQSDERHPINTTQFLKWLETKGIHCGRKTIYSDLDVLMEFGFDIIRTKKGAYIGKRQFELPELKLLVDAVQASRFITEKKSEELIDKIGKLLSEDENKQLRHQVYVKNRVKSMNESIYYNIDALNEAIQKDCQVSFFYWNWNSKKEMVIRQGEKRYQISPWLLVWEDEKYYMVGYDEKAHQMKHYRVDKMKQLAVIEEHRVGRDDFQKIDVTHYCIENFGMFQGRQEQVTLRVDEELVGVLIDRFGKDVWLHSAEAGKYGAVVDVAVSNQFFGWITGLGGKVQIEGPQWVKEEFNKLIAIFIGE